MIFIYRKDNGLVKATSDSFIQVDNNIFGQENIVLSASDKIKRQSGMTMFVRNGQVAFEENEFTNGRQVKLVDLKTRLSQAATATELKSILTDLLNIF